MFISVQFSPPCYNIYINHNILDQFDSFSIDLNKMYYKYKYLIKIMKLYIVISLLLCVSSIDVCRQMLSFDSCIASTKE